jgi:hypothetical protein
MIVIVDVVLTVLERSESVDPLLTKTVFVPPLTLKISTEYVVEDVVAGESKKVKNDTGESSKPDINLADPTVTLALDPAAFPIHSAVESLFSTVAHPTFSAAILMWQMTRILPVLLDGVIDADNPVTAVLAALAKLAENESVLVVLTTCKILPPVPQLNAPLPFVVSTWPLVPFPVGNTRVFEPATAGASISVTPDVAPLSRNVMGLPPVPP